MEEWLERMMSRREFFERAAKLGLGTAAGLTGLTILGGCAPAPTPAAAPTAAPAATSGAAEVVACTGVHAATGKTIRTIGIGPCVQDRFLKEFEKCYGHKGEGTVAGFMETQTKWLAGGYKQWDVNEMQCGQIPIAYQQGTIRELDISRIPKFKDLWPLFRDPAADGVDRATGLPPATVYTPDALAKKTFEKGLLIPTVWGFDGLGYNPEKVVPTPTSFAVLFDEKYKGRVGLYNDPIRSMSDTAGYLTYNNLMPPLKIGPTNLTKEEADIVIKFLIEKKKAGQFRVLWEDYGQCVNLMATAEIWVGNLWNPIVEDTKKLGTPCKYFDPVEGHLGWYHGVSVSTATENVDAAYDYIDFWLGGWPGAQVAPQGYYTSVTSAENYLKRMYTNDLKVNDWDYWYMGKGRDTGALADRMKMRAWWSVWPDEADYYLKRWTDLQSA